MWIKLALLGLACACGPAATNATAVEAPTAKPALDSPTQEKTMTQLTSTSASWRRATQDEERNATIPDSLHFELRGAPSLEDGSKLVLIGALVNPGPAVEVVLFPVHDRSPFFLQMVTSDILEPKPHEGLWLPPEPPPGRVLQVPAESEVLFRESIDMADFSARSFAGAQLRWSFEFWASPKPGGLLTLSDAIAGELDAHFAAQP